MTEKRNYEGKLCLDYRLSHVEQIDCIISSVVMPEHNLIIIIKLDFVFRIFQSSSKVICGGTCEWGSGSARYR